MTCDGLGRHEHRCDRCESVFQGTHEVVDGERCCPECVNPDVPDVDHTGPQTIIGYNAQKRRVIDVAALMDGGDPR